MSVRAEYQLGCDSCQVLSGPAGTLDPHRDPGSVAGDFLAEHHPCGAGYWAHLRLVHVDVAGRERPVAGWWPRPILGPPVPGDAQRVVCPNCQAVGGDGPTDRITWKRTDAGEPFCYCRACGMAWGPGAEADYQRARLRGVARPAPGSILP